LNSHHPVLFYLLIFLGLSLLLKFFGIIEFSIPEIFSYALIFYGISLVYLSFGRNKKAALFVGTVIFLCGLVFFLINNFDFTEPEKLIIPSFMFISGAGFLMLFIDDIYNILLLVISVVFILLGVFSAFILGTVEASSYFISLWYIIQKYWPVAIILAAIIWFLRKEEKNNRGL